MIYPRAKHIAFLNMELTAETEEFEKTFSARADYLLNDAEELFLGIFLKFEYGEMIVKFRSTRSFPRKGEYIYTMYLPAEMQDYRQWSDTTYEQLFANRLKGTEAVCIWHGKASEEGYVIAGFRGIDLSFAEYVSSAPGALLVFGPNRPPIDYLANLYRLVQDEYSAGVSAVLDIDFSAHDTNPILIKERNITDFVRQQLYLSKTVILQGPPGTGKTQLISELCAHLCSAGKSVLMTALTNRALMEMASKPASSPLLKDGRILKSKLTTDEKEELPDLKPIKQILPIPGSIVMATFFITSGFAAGLAGDGAFDYVIMDEASQALLAMFAATKKIGKYNLWVGDTAQLAPIVAINEDWIEKKGFRGLVNGLHTMVSSGHTPIYQLTRTFRFSQRAADYTGKFYNGTLLSAGCASIENYPTLRKVLSIEGGPSLILTDMPVGDVAPRYALDLATFVVNALLQDAPNCDISVLTCLRKTTRALQKAIALRLGTANKVLIDTIARVQGLTTDVTLLFIPNASLIRSLEPHLFNVATSRAREHTIIIADKKILNYPQMHSIVRKYLSDLAADRSIYVPSQSPSQADRRLSGEPKRNSIK